MNVKLHISALLLVLMLKTILAHFNKGKYSHLQITVLCYTTHNGQTIKFLYIAGLHFLCRPTNIPHIFSLKFCLSISPHLQYTSDSYTYISAHILGQVVYSALMIQGNRQCSKFSTYIILQISIGIKLMTHKQWCSVSLSLHYWGGEWFFSIIIT